MELGNFYDFFNNQPQPNIVIPSSYFTSEQKWGYTEILTGLIISNPVFNDSTKLQEINIVNNSIREWGYGMLVRLAWKHEIERQKCIEDMQNYIDTFYPILKGPTNINRLVINRKYIFFKYENDIYYLLCIFFSHYWLKNTYTKT